jgi:hypothetical protein
MLQEMDHEALVTLVEPIIVSMLLTSLWIGKCKEFSVFSNEFIEKIG